MITTAHKIYAGPGAPAPPRGNRFGPRMTHAAHGFALPRHWDSNPFTVLVLPAAIALIGVLGAILCSLVQWD